MPFLRRFKRLRNWCPYIVRQADRRDDFAAFMVIWPHPRSGLHIFSEDVIVTVSSPGCQLFDNEFYIAGRFSVLSSYFSAPVKLAIVNIDLRVHVDEIVQRHKVCVLYLDVFDVVI